jgi:hypothetical protein
MRSGLSPTQGRWSGPGNGCLLIATLAETLRCDLRPWESATGLLVAELPGLEPEKALIVQGKRAAQNRPQAGVPRIRRPALGPADRAHGARGGLGAFCCGLSADVREERDRQPQGAIALDRVMSAARVITQFSEAWFAADQHQGESADEDAEARGDA